jgi:predicted GIY-YIG superfamily endonuclease
MGFYFVYILKNSLTNSLYKGYTSDLKKRIVNHQQKGTRTTSKDDWALIWYCCFPTKRQAIQFEHYLKSGSGWAFINK